MDDKSAFLVDFTEEPNPANLTAIGMDTDGSRCKVLINIGDPSLCMLRFKTLQDAFHFFVDMTDACVVASDKTGVSLCAEGYDAQSSRHS